MIELNERTQQDFLNREWAQKLMNAGVDMSDSKYIIAKDRLSMHDDEPDFTDYIWYKDSIEEVYDTCPTYTVSEMYSKMLEHMSIRTLNDNIVYSGGEHSLVESLADILIRQITHNWV